MTTRRAKTTAAPDRKAVNRILAEAIGWQELEDQLTPADRHRGATPNDRVNDVQGTLRDFDEAATDLLDFLQGHALEYLPLDGEQLAALEREQQGRPPGGSVPVGTIVEPGAVLWLRAIRDEIRELAMGPLAPIQRDERPPAPWREQLVKRLMAAGNTRAKAREALEPDELRARARVMTERSNAAAMARRSR